MCAHTCMEIRGQIVELVLFFHPLNFGDWTQVTRLGSHLVGPRGRYLIWFSALFWSSSLFAIFSLFVRTSIAAEHAKKNGLQTNATSPHASVPTSRLHTEKPAVYKYVLWHVFWIERCQEAAIEMSRFCCTGSLAWVRLLQGQVKMIALFMLRWSLLIGKKQRGSVLAPL